MEPKPTSFAVACKTFFGFLPGQGLKEFQEELKKLTQKDREELAPMLAKELGKPVSA